MQNSSTRNIFSDPEFWMILFFNGLFIYLYLTNDISVGEIVWIYYLQSVLIGFQYFVRMIAGARRSNAKGKYFTPMFFALHYGLFHLVYFVFLTLMSASENGPKANLLHVLYGFAALFINMLFSLTSDLKGDKAQNRDGSSLFFTPYLRIVPMHLFIIMGFNAVVDNNADSWFFRQDAFIIFIILKTISDLLLHIIVNKTWIIRRERTLTEMI